MGVFPTAFSIIVSFLSAITILGTPSEVYMSGTMFLYQGMRKVLYHHRLFPFTAAGWSIASMMTALIFMPKFREMNFASIYEV
jgi:sodium-coupled monocarboxylate transporter 8/12